MLLLAAAILLFCCCYDACCCLVPFCADVMRHLLILATSGVLVFWDDEANAMRVLLAYGLFASRVRTLIFGDAVFAAIAEFVAYADRIGLVSLMDARLQMAHSLRSIVL